MLFTTTRRMPSVPEAGRCTGAPSRSFREVAGAQLAVACFNLLLADFTQRSPRMSQEAARQVSPAETDIHFQD